MTGVQTAQWERLMVLLEKRLAMFSDPPEVNLLLAAKDEDTTIEIGNSSQYPMLLISKESNLYGLSQLIEDRSTGTMNDFEMTVTENQRRLVTSVMQAVLNLRYTAMEDVN